MMRLSKYGKNGKEDQKTVSKILCWFLPISPLTRITNFMTALNYLTLLAVLAIPVSAQIEHKRNKKVEKRKPSAESATMPNVRIDSDSMTVLYGNAFVERLQEHGAFEAWLHAAEPSIKQQFRSVAYTGDQVHYRIRASRFGTHMAYLLNQWKSDRVVMCFGMNESFAGKSGLDTFKKNLEYYIDLIKKRHPKNAYYLVSPIAIEDGHSNQYPDVGSRNTDIALYTQAMKEIAAKQGVKFVDMFKVSQERYKVSKGNLTINGFHLNDKGNAIIGKALASELTGKNKIRSINSSDPGFKAMQKLVSRKAGEVAMAYHPANGISYYGIRARRYEYQPEIPHLLKVANILMPSGNSLF